MSLAFEGRQHCSGGACTAEKHSVNVHTDNSHKNSRRSSAVRQPSNPQITLRAQAHTAQKPMETRTCTQTSTTPSESLPQSMAGATAELGGGRLPGKGGPSPNKKERKMRLRGRDFLKSSLEDCPHEGHFPSSVKDEAHL